MPFDGTEYPGEGGTPRRRGGDNAAVLIIVALAVCLLGLPISIGALVDIVRYLHRG